jgi:hypothetical protein
LTRKKKKSNTNNDSIIGSGFPTHPGCELPSADSAGFVFLQSSAKLLLFIESELKGEKCLTTGHTEGYSTLKRGCLCSEPWVTISINEKLIRTLLVTHYTEAEIKRSIFLSHRFYLVPLYSVASYFTS